MAVNFSDFIILKFEQPEILSENKYNYKVDIWALGLTIISCAEGENPFAVIRKRENEFSMMDAIANKPSP